MRSSRSTRRRPTCRPRTCTWATRCRTRRRSSSSATSACGAATIFYPMGFDDNGLPTERYVEQKYKINKAHTTRSEFRALCLEGDGKRRGRVRALLAQARAVGRLAAALLDDRRPLPAHRAGVVPRPVREGAHLPVRGAGVLGPVDADVARAGRPRDDHPQLDAARHRVPRARRSRSRHLDHPARAHPELRRARTSTPRTSGTPRSRVSTRPCRSAATRCRSSPTTTCAPTSAPG